MKLPFVRSNPLGRFGELLDSNRIAFDTYDNLSRAIDFYTAGKTDVPDYAGKRPETVLKAALKRYLRAKKKLVSFAGTVGVHGQFLANQIRLLEEGETVDRQELLEHYKSLLSDRGNEVIAERNRKTEWYMDKWRKARNPEMYTPDSIDMRACKINLGKFVYNGGIHSTIDALALPESPEQDKAVLNSLLTREEHKPSRDFNLN